MTHGPLPFEDHVAGIAAAVDRMVAWSADAGLDAEVPTCPGWTVRDLVTHQARVHRWALAALRGADLRTTTIDGMDGGDGSDPLAWLASGATELIDTLESAPEDLEAQTFLREAPPARLFWARRQHHETTVHALDALAAREQRGPAASDAWFGDDVAVDAVDELLVGFWQRRTRGPRAEEGGAYRALVVADPGARWLLDVGSDQVRTRRLDDAEPAPEADAVLSAAPVDLYLAVWNRGGRVDDPAGLLTRWRERGAVT